MCQKQNVNEITSVERLIQEPQNEGVKYIKGVGFINHEEYKNALAKRRRQPGRADMTLVREVELYAENNSNTYFGCYDPLVKAASKHAKKGRFNAGKLCKAVRNRCVPLALKNYDKQLGTNMNKLATTADRNVLGARMCKSAISDVQDNLRNR